MKKIFKISALFLAFIMLASFSDVPKTKGERWDWAYSYVSNASELGLMIGDGDGYFRPGDSTSKEETAIIIYRILNYGTDKMTPAARALTPEEAELLARCQISDWAQLYLLDGFASGFWTEADFAERTAEKTAGKMPLPRQKVSEWLVKANSIRTSFLSVLSFADASGISPQAFPYVDACYRTGLMIGDDENKFNPANGVNRAEMAVILTRMRALAADGSEAAAKAEVYGVLGAGSAPGMFSSSGGGSTKTVYVDPSSVIVLDGAKADLSAVAALAGRSVTLSTVIGSNIVVAQTRPRVLSGTVQSVENRGSFDIVTVNLGDVSVPYIRNQETNCGASLAAGTSIRFISDGSNLLEIN